MENTDIKAVGTNDLFAHKLMYLNYCTRRLSVGEK